MCGRALARPGRASSASIDLPEYQADGIFRRMGGSFESAKVGKRGAIIVPAKLRKRFGIEEGTLVTAEEKEDGILIRPAVVIPIERYTLERKAEFLLSNATNQSDYKNARKAVRKLGLDPDSVPHRKPR
jgi:AbrB family looped-hinge helix DNA binding protein